MASYNGAIAKVTYDGSTVSQTLGATATVYSNVVSAVPQKWFNNGLFGIKTTEGVSGGFGCIIVGSIGGATAVIAGATAVTSVGSTVIGATGSASFGFPRPIYIQIEPVAGVAGFTATFTLAGEYN